jgi:hypothetical protein
MLLMMMGESFVSSFQFVSPHACGRFNNGFPFVYRPLRFHSQAVAFTPIHLTSIDNSVAISSDM